jgi:hypothetical protein
MVKLTMFVLILAGVVGQFSRANLNVLDASQPITFFIEDGKGVPGYRESDRELAKMAIEAWARESAGKLKFIDAKDGDTALVRLRWVSANEGLFGETQRIRIHGQPGAVVHVMPQVSLLGEPLATRASGDGLLRDTIVYLTCVHELGHAVGLNHTRNFQDIMYAFGFGGDIVEYFMRYRTKLRARNDIAKYSGLSASDTAVLRELYKN